MGSVVLLLAGIGGCGLLLVAVVAVVWAVSHDRPHKNEQL